MIRRTDLKDRPVVIVRAEGSQKLVLDYSPGLEGLQPEMPLQQALSRQGEVELVQADMPFYWSAFNEILDALELRSPLVEGADLGLAYTGVDGLQMIYPDDDSLIQAVREAIPPTFDARIGLAEGKFLAYLAALYSPPQDNCRVLAGDVQSFLNDLPCEVLPVSLKKKSKAAGTSASAPLGRIVSLPSGPYRPSSDRQAKESGTWPGDMMPRPCTRGSWRRI
jgi:DNA polymerase-4/protein ImuB